MVAERSEATEMLRRHEQERKQFFLDQAKILIDVNFDYKPPVEFGWKHNYDGQGLVIIDTSRKNLLAGGSSIILHPERGLLSVNYNGQSTEYPGDNVPSWLFIKVEKKVNETLAGLQAVAANP